MEFLEKLLGLYGVSLYDEGKHFSRILLVRAWLEAATISRFIAKVWIKVMISSVFFVGAVFALILHGIFQVQQFGTLRVDITMAVSCAIAAASVVYMTFIMGERQWMGLFEIERRLRELEAERRNMAAKHETQETRVGA